MMCGRFTQRANPKDFADAFEDVARPARQLDAAVQRRPDANRRVHPRQRSAGILLKSGITPSRSQN